MASKVNSRQIMLIIALMRISVPVLFLPVVTSADVYQDAWLSAILSALAGCLIGAMAASLCMRFPGKSFGRFSRELLGTGAGITASLLVAAVLYLLALIRTRLMTLTIITELMPRTPGWAMAIPALLVALYGAVAGADAMGRAVEPLFIVIVGTIATGSVLLFVSGAGPIDNLKPVLERGMGPVIEASLAPTFFSATSASVVLALGKYATRPQGLRKAAVWGIIISGIVLVILAILVTVTIGPRQARIELSPVLALASTVFIEGVIERLDLFLIMIWALGVVFDVTMLLLSSSVLLGDAFDIRPEYVSLGLFCLGIPAVSLRVTDIFTGKLVLSPGVTFATMLVVHIGVVGLVYVTALVRDRRRRLR